MFNAREKLSPVGTSQPLRQLRLLARPTALLVSLMILAAVGASADDQIKVFVSIAPQAYFVNKIGGEFIDVQVMVPPGASPVTYEPKPRQMVALAEAKVYFAIGVPFENVWLEKIAAANPRMTVAHTDAGVQKLPMAAHLHFEDHDGVNQTIAADTREDNRRPARLLDPHIWLAPPLVKTQALNIYNYMAVLDPVHQTQYRRNYERFLQEIDTLDRDLRDLFADSRDRPFMVFHPAWGYFARCYGLIQIPVEIEGKEPKPAQLQDIIVHAKKDNIGVIFVQPQFSMKSARLIARQIGAVIVAADPLAADWAANLRSVAAEFKQALQGKAT